MRLLIEASINSEPKMLVKADKTTNYYKLTTDEYNSLLEKNITKGYKKATKQQTKQVEQAEKTTAKALALENRMEAMAPKQAFITLKDHKPNFQNNPSYRLINPAKSELGKVSKQILDRINTQIAAKSSVNQWKNTSEVLDWFNNSVKTERTTFITFDVCEFYPSITEQLLNKALDFAQELTNITDQERNIITLAKKSLLFYKDKCFAKKDSDDLFDVTMGSFDGAETCELVGAYLLTQMPENIKKQIGLYRDDGLAMCTATPRTVEKTKQEICKVFKNNGLKITIEANKKVVDFLDVTLNLNEHSYTPYNKPNNTVLYVHNNSNHPRNVLKNIPPNINNRLSKISSNQHEFDKAANTYQQALQSSKHNHKLKYQKPETKMKTKNRKRNITWYNPPFSCNVTTKIGTQFLKIIDKCFPKTHILHRIFNRNTLKISYSCMPNMRNIIEAHNKKLLNNNQGSKDNDTPKQMCNCRDKSNCPMEGKCLEKNIIYQATVTRTDNNNNETYIGLCSTTFKQRYANHKTSIEHKHKRHSTELSNYIWKLKEQNIPYVLKWKILRHSKPYSNISKTCQLCLNEKFFIIYKPSMCSLNNRNELATSCRHRKSYLLNN